MTISRREALRRGAIGGALVWAAPVVRTIPAFAHEAEGSPTFTCCTCYVDPTAIPPEPSPPNHPDSECYPGFPRSNGPVPGVDCETFCKNTLGFTRFEWHAGPTPIGCVPAGVPDLIAGTKCATGENHDEIPPSPPVNHTDN